MKMKQLFLATALVVSAGSFAQKDEMKTLKKLYAIERPTAKDVAEYKAAIAKAEPLVAASTESDKVYLDFYKAMTPILEISVPENAQNQIFVANAVSLPKIKHLSASVNAVLEFEKKNGKKVYTDDINETIQSYKPMLLNYAIALGEKNQHKQAAEVLYAIYELDKKDTDNLYYAASYAVNGQDFDNALKYYGELKAMNYSGEKTVYMAKSKISDQYEPFPDKAKRDTAVRIGTHSAPKEEQEPSKKAEIYSNTAKILISQKKTDQAKAAIAEARAAAPDDTSLMIAEADMYLELKDDEGYKKVANEMLQKNPNDPDMVYNLGVLAFQKDQLADAEKHFNRVIEIKPDYTNAYVNLAAIKLKGDKPLVDQMNKLGTSAAEQKKYDQLKVQRIALFKSTLPILEKAYALDPKNEGVIDNLISVYGYLEMKEKRAALKAQVGR